MPYPTSASLHFNYLYIGLLYVCSTKGTTNIHFVRQLSLVKRLRSTNQSIDNEPFGPSSVNTLTILQTFMPLISGNFLMSNLNIDEV